MDVHVCNTVYTDKFFTKMFNPIVASMASYFPYVNAQRTYF